MRQRWLPVGILVGALFLINVVVRLVVRFGFDGTESAEGRATLIMLSVIALLFAVLAFLWGRRHPVGRLTADLGAAGVVGCALTILVGPFISAGTPFESGAGAFFAQIWQYAGFAGGGALLGFLVCTAFGLDYRSQSLKRYAERKLTKPRRVVRR